mgnify:CR=1 FL=1
MWRRKLRSLLTIFGIAVGIFAFTVMGSMALRLNKMIAGGKSYITGQITIMPKGSSFGAGGSVLPIDTINNIAKVDGVEAVSAGVELMLEEPDPNNPQMSFGPPPSIEGMDFTSTFENRNWKTLAMKEGHFLTKEDGEDAVAVGITVATDKNLKVGDTTKIRGKEFRVVGIIDQTLTGPDSYVFMPIAPAREMLIASNPFLKSLKEQADQAATISAAALAKLPAATRDQILNAKAFKVEDVNTGASVSWKDGADSEKVAAAIEEQFKDEAQVLSPKKMGELIDKGTAVINAVVLGSAVLALIVGGFSIINTMVMAISERTKEIGIKKAIGASRRSIAWDYTLEAGVIGIVGGLIGMGLGVLVVWLLNAKTSSSGAEIFLLDVKYLAGVVLFSFVLGMIAGVIPAIRASRLKVVQAIREL